MNIPFFCTRPSLLSRLLLWLFALAPGGLWAATTVHLADVSPGVLPPGYPVKITYNWDAEPMNADYTVFVHIRDASNNLVAQDDHNPPFPTKTSTWSGPNSWTRNKLMPATLPNGEYRIIIGLYNGANGNQQLDEGPGVTNPTWSTWHQVGTFTIDDQAAPPPLDSDIPVTLDLTGFTLTFSEEFDGPLDISNWGPGTKWIAHTPYAGDFGDAWFTSPTANPSPFTVSAGELNIRAWYDTGASHWRSGLLSSVDTNGNGFYQQYGYFEMRAKFPEGPGTWPAFWLLARERLVNPSTADGFEIDVVEQYGHAQQTLHAVYHIWRADGSHSGLGNTFFVDNMTTGYHTYGILWTEQEMVWYFDGKELWRQPTPEEGKQPMYILANLALGAGWPITNTPDPSDMKIDYIRAYALPSGGQTLVFEAEEVAQVAATDSVSNFSSGSASNGECERLNANAVGDSVTYTLPNVPAGTYQVYVGAKRYSTRGQFHLSIEGTPQGGMVDQYQNTSEWVDFDMGEVTVGSAGDLDFEFEVAGKNASSTGFELTVDHITLSTEAPSSGFTLLVEAEDVATVAASDTVTNFSSGLASGGQAERLNANAIGDYITYTVPDVPAGSYTVKVGAKEYVDRGQFQLSIDGLDQGGVTDENGAEAFVEYDLGNRSFPTLADRDFTFTVVGTSGSNYRLTVDYILLEADGAGSSTLNFNDYTINSYSSQDGSGTATVQDGGDSLEVAGNAWKAIDFSYQVTAYTVLEFDYRSTQEGEIQSIGFDSDNNYGTSANYLFQLQGTQTWGTQDYRDYTGSDWVHYTIPVGQHFTGSMSQLVFANDHDGGAANGNGTYRNVRVYEAD